MGRWRRSITRHRSSLSKTSVYDGREAYGKTKGWHCRGGRREEGEGGDEPVGRTRGGRSAGRGSVQGLDWLCIVSRVGS